MLAGATVLGLPLDVANNAGYAGCDGYNTAICGGLDMTLFWSIFFWLIPVWIFVMIPFSAFYYEADEDPPEAKEQHHHSDDEDPEGKKKDWKPPSRFKRALCNLSVLLFMVAIVFGLTFLFWGHTNVPVRHFEGGTLVGDARPAGVIYEIQPRFNESNPDQTLPFTPGQFQDMLPNDALLLSLVERDPKMEHLKLNVDAVTFYAGLMVSGVILLPA